MFLLNFIARFGVFDVFSEVSAPPYSMYQFLPSLCPFYPFCFNFNPFFLDLIFLSFFLWISPFVVLR